MAICDSFDSGNPCDSIPRSIYLVSEHQWSSLGLEGKQSQDKGESHTGTWVVGQFGHKVSKISDNT